MTSTVRFVNRKVWLIHPKPDMNLTEFSIEGSENSRSGVARSISDWIFVTRKNQYARKGSD